MGMRSRLHRPVVVPTVFGLVLVAASSGCSSSNPLTPAVARVEVTPAVAIIEVGDTLPLSAYALDASGDTVKAGQATWSSSVALVATVSDTGVVAGVNMGTTTVEATIGGVTGTSTIQVVAPTIGSVVVIPSTMQIAVGDTARFTAVAERTDGRVLSGEHFAWVSGFPNIATVDQSGLVTGVSVGTTTIVAACGEVVDSVTVEVTAAQPAGMPSVVYLPGNAPPAAGPHVDFPGSPPQ